MRRYVVQLPTLLVVVCHRAPAFGADSIDSLRPALRKVLSDAFGPECIVGEELSGPPPGWSATAPERIYGMRVKCPEPPESKWIVAPSTATVWFIPKDVLALRIDDLRELDAYNEQYLKGAAFNVYIEAPEYLASNLFLQLQRQAEKSEGNERRWLSLAIARPDHDGAGLEQPTLSLSREAIDDQVALLMQPIATKPAKVRRSLESLMTWGIPASRAFVKALESSDAGVRAVGIAGAKLFKIEEAAGKLCAIPEDHPRETSMIKQVETWMKVANALETISDPCVPKTAARGLQFISELFRPGVLDDRTRNTAVIFLYVEPLVTLAIKSNARAAERPMLAVLENSPNHEFSLLIAKGLIALGGSASSPALRRLLAEIEKTSNYVNDERVRDLRVFVEKSAP